MTDIKTVGKHTPGPWLIADNTFVYSLNGRGTNVFWSHVQPGWKGHHAEKRTSSEEIEANAKLICAAPDLIKSAESARCILVAIRDGSMSRNNQEQMIDEALAELINAIAKAWGGA